MESRIDTISEKKLVGRHLKMSLANNRTRELWHSFMTRRQEIKNAVTTDMYSMQLFDDTSYFDGFNPSPEFEKWAAIEVAQFGEVPEGMDTFLTSQQSLPPRPETGDSAGK